MEAELPFLRRDCELRRIPPALRRGLRNGCGTRPWSPGGARRSGLRFTGGGASTAAVVPFALLLLPLPGRAGLPLPGRAGLSLPGRAGLPLPHLGRVRLPDRCGGERRPGGLPPEVFQPVGDFFE